MSARNYIQQVRVAALASGLALAFGTGIAIAQPGPGGGPHGMHGGPQGGGEPIAQVFQQYKAQLALNTSQQQLWDNAVALGKQARDSGRTLMQQTHTSIAAELAKAEPDLAAAAALTDDTHAKIQALRKQVRDEWLKLYATFTPAQKTIVRDALTQRMQHMEQMAKRFGGNG